MIVNWKELEEKGFVDEMVDPELDITLEIDRMRKEKNAIILAHYYQEGEIQDIADFVGDSLELARKCTQVEAATIVFCGVHFMAETAAILNPECVVLLAQREAGCPMADMISAASVRDWQRQHPLRQIC